MTSAEFTQHIRFSLLHLYEVSLLEQGPARALADWISQVAHPAEAGEPGARLRALLVATIDRMKPEGPLNPALPAHRSYLILKRRYVDRLPIQQLEAEFSSSSRQFRRDNHRAVEELALALSRLPRRAPEPGQAAREDGDPAPGAAFDRHVGPASLWELVTEASKTLAPAIQAAGVAIRTDVPPELPEVGADRVALRLALIKLLWVAIAHCPSGVLRLRLAAVEAGAQVELRLSGIADLDAGDTALGEAARLFELAGGALAPFDAGAGSLAARLPVHRRPVVLVVDDDPAMPRIIQRYLALQPFDVVGCRSTDDVLGLAGRAQPAVILLDILMPGRDGWEVLQELKSDPRTYHINLAVCSIWDERDLALMLGADAFFQKPIDRAALLDYVSPYAR